MTGCDNVGEEVYFWNCGGGVRLLQRKKNLPQKSISQFPWNDSYLCPTEKSSSENFDIWGKTNF